MIDLCKETKIVMTYPATNLRVAINGNVLYGDSDHIPVNYVNDSLFALNYPLLESN